VAHKLETPQLPAEVEASAESHVSKHHARHHRGSHHHTHVDGEGNGPHATHAKRRTQSHLMWRLTPAKDGDVPF